MLGELKDMILDEIKQDYVKELILKNEREDKRELMEFRKVLLEKNFVPNAEGSCLAHLGDTKVLAGVKIGLDTPFSDRPNEGLLSFNAEFVPMAHPDFEPGPPREDAIELARVVDRGIRGAESIDLKKLGQTDVEAKVLSVYVDLWVLDNCGNLIDAAALAAMSALKNTRMPKLEDGKLVRTESKGPLELTRSVLTCSFEKISGKNVLDSNLAEQIASSGRLTLGVTDDNFVVCGQKSGEAGFLKDEIMSLIDTSFAQTKPLFKQL